jgi:hypothetical protein
LGAALYSLTRPDLSGAFDERIYGATEGDDIGPWKWGFGGFRIVSFENFSGCKGWPPSRESQLVFPRIDEGGGPAGVKEPADEGGGPAGVVEGSKAPEFFEPLLGVDGGLEEYGN